MILKNTISLCPVCLCDTAASIIEENGMAVMEKTCPEHGLFRSIVESDVEFYRMVQRNNAEQFYGGLIIDITYRCNLCCKWCFQHLEDYDVPTERIYALASQIPKGTNIILSGGEPTIRVDLPVIVAGLVKLGYTVNVITNGLLLDWSLPCSWTLSHHKESQDIFNARVQEAILGDKQFNSIIYTDIDLDTFYGHVTASLELGKVASIYRMHIAAPVGDNSTDPHQGIFVSDMYKYLVVKGHTLEMSSSKTTFVPVKVDGTQFMLISWPTIENTDLVENHCQPWYHGKGNSADNIVSRILRDN